MQRHSSQPGDQGVGEGNGMQVTYHGLERLMHPANCSANLAMVTHRAIGPWAILQFMEIGQMYHR